MVQQWLFLPCHLVLPNCSNNSVVGTLCTLCSVGGIVLQRCKKDIGTHCNICYLISEHPSSITPIFTLKK